MLILSKIADLDVNPMDQTKRLKIMLHFAKFRPFFEVPQGYEEKNQYVYGHDGEQLIVVLRHETLKLPIFMYWNKITGVRFCTHSAEIFRHAKNIKKKKLLRQYVLDI